MTPFHFAPMTRHVAVKGQYPGVAQAVRADMQNLGIILRLMKRIAPGLDVKATAEEIRTRIGDELDYELEAQNQRTMARIYRWHPFIAVPDVSDEMLRVNADPPFMERLTVPTGSSVCSSGRSARRLTRFMMMSTSALSQIETALSRIRLRVSSRMKDPPPVATIAGPWSSRRAITRASPSLK